MFISLDLATITTWIMIIGVAVLIYVSYITSKHHSHKPPKKKNS